MVQYATAIELAGKLQKDLDTYSADQVLTIASALFSREADMWWAPQSITYTTLGTWCTRITLPFRPVTAVSAVRINGIAVTGWTLRKNALYRPSGFGTSCMIPPDQVDIDLTHGETSPPDDVKGGVLETAGQAYEVPNGAIVALTIDDYAVKYATSGGMQLTDSARRLAEMYRGTLAA